MMDKLKKNMVFYLLLLIDFYIMVGTGHNGFLLPVVN